MIGHISAASIRSQCIPDSCLHIKATADREEGPALQWKSTICEWGKGLQIHANDRQRILSMR